MKITTITVGYKETCSLPEYSNVAPSVSLTAELNGEDADTAYEALMTEARHLVQEQINNALEEHGRRPKYWGGVRYQVLRHDRYGVVLLLLDEATDIPSGCFSVPGIERGLRYEAACHYAEKEAKRRGYVVLICTDGDFAPFEKIKTEHDAQESRVDLVKDSDWKNDDAEDWDIGDDDEDEDDDED